MYVWWEGGLCIYVEVRSHVLGVDSALLLCEFLGIEHGSLGLAASTFACRATLPAQYWGFSKAGGYMSMWVHWIDRMRDRKQGGRARGECRFKHVAKDSCPHLDPTCPTRSMASVDALNVFRDIFIVILFEEMTQTANICTGTDSNGVWAPSLLLLRTHMGQASHPFFWVASSSSFGVCPCVLFFPNVSGPGSFKI